MKHQEIIQIQPEGRWWTGSIESSAWHTAASTSHPGYCQSLGHLPSSCVYQQPTWPDKPTLNTPSEFLLLILANVVPADG